MAAGLLSSSSIGVIGDAVPNEGKLYTRPGEVIVAVGDSLTQGNVNNPWFTQMKTAMDLFYLRAGKTAPTWVNSGVGGSGAVYFEGNIATTINAHSPNLVFIEVGINDVANLTLQQHIDLMNGGIDDITGSPRLVIISPFARQVADTSLNPEIRLMRDAQATIARERSAVFIDWRAYADSISAAALAARLVDGIHPTDPAGNAWLSDKVMRQTNMRTT